MEELEQTKAKTDVATIGMTLLTVFSGYSLLIDLYTDIFVTWLVYEAQKKHSKESRADYTIALIVCFTSLASTFMIT